MNEATRSPITALGPDFPFGNNNWISHPAGLGHIPTARQGVKVAIIGAGAAAAASTVIDLEGETLYAETLDDELDTGQDRGRSAILCDQCVGCDESPGRQRTSR